MEKTRIEQTSNHEVDTSKRLTAAERVANLRVSYMLKGLPLDHTDAMMQRFEEKILSDEVS